MYRFLAEPDDVLVVPSMGDSITEGDVGKWYKNVGDRVAVDDIVVEIESDKINVEIRAKRAGILTEQLVESGTTVVIGQEVARLGDDDGSAPPPPAEAAPAASVEVKVEEPAPVVEAPKPAVAKKEAKPTKKAAAASSSVGGNDPRERRVPMSRMRKRIAERMKEAQNTAACLTTFQEVDMTNLIALRSQFKDEFEKKHEVKLGFMSAFVKASASALMSNPLVNATIDGNDIVYRDYVDVSVAVATPTGLVVPVLRDCHKMNFADVEKAINYYAQKARDGNLEMEDMVGGTFTISNGGVYGSMMGTPILNPPQSAILGMHGITKKPMVVNGEVKVRDHMYLALTYDHRLIDGRDAVTFLVSIKKALENPSRLLLDL